MTVALVMALGTVFALLFRGRTRALSCVVILFAAVVPVVGRLCSFSPGRDTESKFFANFDPTRVMTRYVTLRDSRGSETSASGYRYPWKHKDVSYERKVTLTFRPDPTGYEPMMIALAGDLKRALSDSRAVITSESMQAGQLTIHYCSGRTTGSVVVEPPKPADGVRDYDGLTIRVQEKWAVEA